MLVPSISPKHFEGKLGWSTSSIEFWSRWWYCACWYRFLGMLLIVLLYSVLLLWMMNYDWIYVWQMLYFNQQCTFLRVVESIKFTWDVKDLFQSFQSFENSVCYIAFVFKMSSFHMESFKVMEKFDGGNFHLWKFKMRMMHFKHGLWKFVDESATLPSEEVARANYNEKEMKAFALLCEHLTDAQLAHIQYCDNVRSAWEALYDVHEAKTTNNKLFLRLVTIKMQERDHMLVHINTMKALVDQLCSIKVNIMDENVYMVLLMNLPPSFNNLVTSLESMSIKDINFNSL